MVRSNPEFQACIKLDYDTGIRAYRANNGHMVFKLRDGQFVLFNAIDPMNQGSVYWAIRWRAMRDYQDAERKKGNLIRLKEDDEWFVSDLGNQFFTTGQTGGTPLIFMHGHQECSEWRIVFTNFRWRAGYPKASSRHECHEDNSKGGDYE